VTCLGGTPLFASEVTSRLLRVTCVAGCASVVLVGVANARAAHHVSTLQTCSVRMLHLLSESGISLPSDLCPAMTCARVVAGYGVVGMESASSELAIYA
jgi:hypothetical protein